MSEDNIWMPLYIGDYLSDTQLLTTEQHGAYMLLIMAYWKNKAPLPDNDEILMSVCKLTPAKWKKVKPALMQFFISTKDGLKHKRIEKELKNTKEKRETAKAKAKKAAEKRWANDASRNARSNAPSNASSITPSNASSSSPSSASRNASHSHNNTPYQSDEVSHGLNNIPDGLVDSETGEVLSFGEGGQ